MKRFLLNLKAAITAALLALPVLALPQEQNDTESSADSLRIGTDTIYYYEPNSNFSVFKGTEISPDNIDTVVVYSLTTDLYIEKRDDVSSSDIESLVKQYLPDARFKWDSGPYDYRGSITTNSPELDTAVEALLNNNAIEWVSKKYIRKDLKDLMDLYPFASEIKVGAFGNMITVYYLDESTWEIANGLIESLGLSFYIVDDSRADKYKRALLKVSKSLDVVSVANKLYESGYFLLAMPSIGYGTIKKCKAQDIDHSDIPFYYGERNGSKQYLYKVPNGFAVRKDSETEMAQMESLIKSYCKDYCRITWLSEDYCLVKAYPEAVKNAIKAMSKIDYVKWVSDMYLDNMFYLHYLKYDGRMPFWGLDGRLTLVFKNDVSDSVKNSIINDYDLSLLSSETKREVVKWVYELPKTKDVVAVCNSIYETGYVQYAIPNIIKEEDGGVHHDDGSSTTSVKQTETLVNETGKQYYDLLGRRKDSPSGLTIVVTRFSDGSTKTEKLLFR